MRKLILICLLLVIPAVAQEPAPVNKPVASVGNHGPSVDERLRKMEEKKTPETFAIPDARKDKVTILQKDVELIGFRMAELERQFKEQQALQRQAADKWTAELMSAMKLAGVEEKDFGLYEYNRETMMFTKKKAEAPTPKP